VRLSEARLSHLAHAFLDAIERGLGRVTSEHRFLAEAKRVLLEETSLEGRIDQLARARIPPAVQPGSRDWDVLYRRYCEEERRKLRRP
jgi:predicted nucleic acid-binding protein